MLTQSLLRRCHWRCAHAWFMRAALRPRVGEISWSIFSVCEPEPPLWLCPGTGWLLSPCLTNPAPLQQISLLPILVNIMRADLQASRGARQHLRVCVWLDGRMREERMLWRLEIYWLSSAASLSTSFLSPPQVSYSLAVYLCWWYRPLLCSMLQPPTDPPPPPPLLYKQRCRGLQSVPTAFWWQQRTTAIKCCARRPPPLANPFFRVFFSHRRSLCSFDRHDKTDAAALCWFHGDAVWIRMNASARAGSGGQRWRWRG